MTGSIVELDAGGVRYRIRRACPADRDYIIGFLSSLDRETLYYRFMAVVRDFNDYVSRILQPGNVVVVAEAEGDRIVGMAEAIRVKDGIAEVGIVVHPEHRGRGLAKALGNALRIEGAREGLTRFIAYILPENYLALVLARKFGFKIVENYGDAILVALDLGVETPEPGTG